MGGCQNRGPFSGTLNNRCRIIIGTPNRDHSFDNHSYGLQGSCRGLESRVTVPGCGVLKMEVEGLKQGLGP